MLLRRLMFLCVVMALPLTFFVTDIFAATMKVKNEFVSVFDTAAGELCYRDMATDGDFDGLKAASDAAFESAWSKSLVKGDENNPPSDLYIKKLGLDPINKINKSGLLISRGAEIVHCDVIYPPDNSLFHEAEDYSAIIIGSLSDPQQIRIESKTNASNGAGVHVGPDSNINNEGIGDALLYELEVPEDMSNARIAINYSDDVNGNVIAIYIDGLRKGSFITTDTGTWNDFQWACQKVDLGYLSKGSHTLKLEVIAGGSYGAIIDCFEINEIRTTAYNDQHAAYLFVKGLIDPNTGLAKSTECEDFTTVYKNALAAMAFIHEGDLAKAEGIFNFFNSKYNPTFFQGFTQYWNARTGEIAGNINYWEGDNAFLLIALEYYSQINGGYGEYQSMVDGLVTWLAQSGNSNDNTIISEGVIDIFAALKPFEASLPVNTPDVLLKLQSSFIKHAVYSNVADHIERAALTLGLLEGFDYITNFQKTDTWRHDNLTQVEALSAFHDKEYINTEISGQLLLSWKIWQNSLTSDLSYISTELEKMWLNGSKDPNVRGIPYLTCDKGNPSDPFKSIWPVWFDSPIIDSTCYLLFYYWGFNPMAPGKKSFDLDYDFLECENFTSQTGNGNLETHSDAVGEETFQISSEPNEVIYQLNLHQSYDNAIFHIRYSDDVAGNLIQVYVDNIYKGEFTTIKTTSWNDFTWNSDVILDKLSDGSHVLKLVSSGGTYGVNLDVIKIMDQ